MEPLAEAGGKGYGDARIHVVAGASMEPLAEAGGKDGELCEVVFQAAASMEPLAEAGGKLLEFPPAPYLHERASMEPLAEAGGKHRDCARGVQWIACFNGAAGRSRR